MFIFELLGAITLYQLKHTVVSHQEQLHWAKITELGALYVQLEM
jgi:hypothetical protein